MDNDSQALARLATAMEEQGLTLQEVAERIASQVSNVGVVSAEVPFTDRISVTYQDAALMTGQSVAVIRRAVRRGDLVAHYPTSKPVILVEELDAWIRGSPTDYRS